MGDKNGEAGRPRCRRRNQIECPPLSFGDERERNMNRDMLLWLLGPRSDRRAILIAALASTLSTASLAETLSPEADACKASGLIALKQKSPQVKDIEIDLDSAKIINADTKIEEVPIKTVVIGEAYIERAKSAKPQTFVCIIGDKGKVLLTLFSDK
jgi:hypothetical protein